MTLINHIRNLLTGFSTQGKMVAEATAPRRENVPGHILFYFVFGFLEIPRSSYFD